jgi:hypothetical protein
MLRAWLTSMWLMAAGVGSHVMTLQWLTRRSTAVIGYQCASLTTALLPSFTLKLPGITTTKLSFIRQTSPELGGMPALSTNRW